ncbi:hypothetical protein ABPG74_015553 [Tetrahymena malaccensis]
MNSNSLIVSNTYFSIDKALEYVGDNSRFQKGVINILSITWMLFSFMIMGQPFLFQEPVFKCKFSETDTDLKECSFQQACKAHYKEIDMEQSSDSVTLDFELYCDRQYLIGVCGSIFFAGNAISGFIFPPLSNKKGRKFALCLSILLAGVSIILCAFSHNIVQFMIMFFFCGVGLNGFETISLVYVSEISAEKFRNYSTISLGCAWSIAQILYGFITYYINSWRYQCIFLMGIPFLILFWIARGYLLETPRYLVSKSRFADARAVLNIICHRNKKPQFQYKLEGEVEEENYYTSAYETPEEKYSSYYNYQQQNNYGYLDLFRYPSIRITTLYLVIFWSFRYMIYYGQSLSLSSLGAEMHSNLTLTAISETVAILMSAPIKLKMKRKPSLFWFSLITALCCISLIFLNIPENCYLDQQACIQKGLIVFSAMGIRFGISVFGGILMTYTSERYPTVVRSLGYGICIASGKIITIFVPLIVVFVQSYNLNPLAFFGFIGIGAAILCRFITETFGQPLQDQLEETTKNEIPLIEMGNMSASGRLQKSML